MSQREATMQQLDPLSAQTSYDVAIFAGIVAWVYVIFAALLGGVATPNSWLMIVSVSLFTAAIVLHIWSSTARQAPYTRWRYTLVVGFALAAAILQIISMGNADVSLINDWGTLALAFVLASASGFRPVREQYIFGGISTVGIALALLLSGAAQGHPFGPGYFVLAAIAPLAIVIVGQASYSGFGVRTIRKWQRQMLYTSQNQVSAGRDLDSRVSYENETFVGYENYEFEQRRELDRFLNQSVSPLLTKVLTSGRITKTTNAEATKLAESVRRHLVAMSEQNWLSKTGVKTLDKNGLALQFDSSSQAALTALIAGMKNAGCREISIELTTVFKRSRINVDISAISGPTGIKVRTELAAYLRVMYVLFENVRVNYRDNKVTLLCEYGEKSNSN